MFYLHHNLNISQTLHIYHINTNEIYLKRLFNKYKLTKRNILVFHYNNRANIDLFFWHTDYLKETNPDNDKYILFKNEYKEFNFLLRYFCPSPEFLKEFKKEKEFNPSCYIQNIQGVGAFFISKSGKSKKYFYCDRDNNSKIKSTNFQLDMFEYTKYDEQRTNKVNEQSIKNENKLTELLS